MFRSVNQNGNNGYYSPLTRDGYINVIGLPKPLRRVIVCSTA